MTLSPSPSPSPELRQPPPSTLSAERWIGSSAPSAWRCGTQPQPQTNSYPHFQTTHTSTHAHTHVPTLMFTLVLTLTLT